MGFFHFHCQTEHLPETLSKPFETLWQSSPEAPPQGTMCNDMGRNACTRSCLAPIFPVTTNKRAVQFSSSDSRKISV